MQTPFTRCWLIAALCLTFACKKSSEPPFPVSKRLSSVNILPSGGIPQSFTFAADARDNLTRIARVNAFAPGTYVSDFGYDGSYKVTSHILTGPGLFANLSPGFEYNAQGTITRSQGNRHDIRYQYDADGFLTSTDADVLGNTRTRYERDASGNVLRVYVRIPGASVETLVAEYGGYDTRRAPFLALPRRNNLAPLLANDRYDLTAGHEVNNPTRVTIFNPGRPSTVLTLTNRYDADNFLVETTDDQGGRVIYSYQ